MKVKKDFFKKKKKKNIVKRNASRLSVAWPYSLDSCLPL